MTIEKFSEGAGVGSFSRIEKTTWQPIGRDSWIVPTIQQAIISTSKGALVGACGIIASVAISMFNVDLWPLVGLSCAGGVVYGLYDFSENIAAMLEIFRQQEISKEVYEKETAGAAGRVEERVVLETHTKQGAGVLTDYDFLQCSESDLIAITKLDALSVRTLQEVGLPFDKAKRLIAELEKQNFIFRIASNQAAVWTEDKGLSLVQKYRNVLEMA